MPHPLLYVSDGTVAGTVPVTVPGLAAINGSLSVVGSDVVFEGTDTSGRQALFESDGTAAGSRELTLPAGITVDANTVIAALPTSTHILTGTLPTPLHTGMETVTGTGGMAGLQLERIAQGSYNTPGQAGWVTATVAPDHSWSVKLNFTKPGMLAHVYAQNGATGAVVDLVNGTPIAAAMSGVSGSVAADMTAKANIPASAQVTHLSGSSMAGGFTIPEIGNTTIDALAVPDHPRTVWHA